jgi:hypothetical protein
VTVQRARRCPEAPTTGAPGAGGAGKQPSFNFNWTPLLGGVSKLQQYGHISGGVLHRPVHRRHYPCLSACLSLSAQRTFVFLSDKTNRVKLISMDSQYGP